jgi:hypothetical protein
VGGGGVDEPLGLGQGQRAQARQLEAGVAREPRDRDRAVRAGRLEGAAGERAGAVVLIRGRPRAIAGRVELGEAGEPPGVLRSQRRAPRRHAQEAHALAPLRVLVAAGDDEHLVTAEVGERERHDVPGVIRVEQDLRAAPPRRCRHRGQVWHDRGGLEQHRRRQDRGRVVAHRRGQPLGEAVDRRGVDPGDLDAGLGQPAKLAVEGVELAGGRDQVRPRAQVEGRQEPRDQLVGAGGQGQLARGAPRSARRCSRAARPAGRTPGPTCRRRAARRRRRPRPGRPARRRARPDASGQ